MVSTVSGAHTATSSAPSSLVSVNLHPSLPLKLSSTNFLLWCAQFLPLLHGHNLLGYVDGSFPRPSPVSSDGSTVLLTILLLIFGIVKKGIATVMEFRLEVHSIADALAAINSPALDEDLVLAVLRGLRDDYKDFATSVRLRVESISFLDLLGLLLTQELYLQSSASATTSGILTANVSTRGGSEKSRGGSDKSWSRYRGGSDRFRRSNNWNQARSPDRNRGSNNHITADLSNLAISESYNGSDGVIVGNGQALSITCFGSTSMVSSGHIFSHTTVLCVPSIHCNLLSIS
ncbi:uncharacterized protein LOC122650751 [Telopea speciosissima]|uniref:uncharacterized protein LOC122650751 n=1 Tax=Telopea speciosissima TaxID=54955 RepID=UPI001CC59856|nr:uncharacterized protein LOC122650751 [Telopea speciosissima]